MTLIQLAVTTLFLAGSGAVFCFSRPGGGWKAAGALLAILALTPVVVLAILAYVLSQIRV